MIKKYRVLKQTVFFFFISYISIFIFSLTLYSSNIHTIFSYEVIIKSILTSMILWYLLYFSSFHKYFYYLIITLLTLILTVKIYYSFILGVHIEPSVFEGMFDTNIDEAKRLGSNKPFFISLAILSFITILIEFNWFKSFPLKRRVLMHFTKLSIALILLVGYGLHKNNLTIKEIAKLLKQTFPISFASSFYVAADARYRLHKMNNSKIDIVKRYNFSLKNNENLTVVFVRAEALRARSFPITDNKIPFSQRIDDINNTVFYNNVFSYANYTQAAVPWMLTRSVDDTLQNEKSLISVVRHMGFDTTWLGCDHSNIANFATPIVNYSLEANRSLFLGKIDDWIRTKSRKYLNQIIGSEQYDGRQFAYALSYLNSRNKKKKFLWIEMNGSHVPWWQVLPPEIKISEPICKNSLDEIKSCSQTSSVNTYNGTIQYSQYLLRKIILLLKNKNAIVILASDHGESTGENGYYGHGFMLPEGKRKIRDQINPAFMVWMSNTFKNNHQTQFNNLKNNSLKTMKHDIIFHSLLDIIGIKSPIIDKTKSIFSNKFIGRKKEFTEIKDRKGIVINSFLKNKATFHLKQNNPKAGTIGKINFKISDKMKNIKIVISDMYKKVSHPNRIKYRVIYNNHTIIEKDLAENNQTLAEVGFLPNNHNITVEIEAQKGIEKDWSWGSVAKVQIKFIEDNKK